jgi:hypothetical protein
MAKLLLPEATLLNGGVNEQQIGTTTSDAGMDAAIMAEER